MARIRVRSRPAFRAAGATAWRAYGDSQFEAAHDPPVRCYALDVEYNNLFFARHDFDFQMF